MQLTTVSRLCSLFLVQCILTICVQTAPAITAKLLRDLQKRQLEENETKNESEETAVVVHDYAKSIQRNRQFWQRRNCDLDFHCAPVAIQHCTNQIGKLTSQEAFKENSVKPSTVCDSDFLVYIQDLDTVTGLDISLYIRTDVMDPNLAYHLFLIHKDLTPQVITNRTLDSNCEGWQTFRYIPGKKDTEPVELKEGDNKITIFIALYKQRKNSEYATLQTCADVKKLVYLDVNDVDFFSYIQSKTAQSENRKRREATETDASKEKITADASSSKSTDTSSAPTTKPMETTSESLPTTKPSTTPITSEAESLSNTTETPSIASSSSTTESPSTASSSSTTDSLLSTTESTTEAATTEMIPMQPVLSEEESFLPIITVFINTPYIA